jgi:hypothetical protein
MKTKKFQKRKEDFVCEHCGADVSGTGYTNHCSECLWSKHVDVNPGDREEECHGLMKPVSIEIQKGTHKLIHKCVVCGAQKKNKVSDFDDTKAVLELVQRQANREMKG